MAPSKKIALSTWFLVASLPIAAMAQALPLTTLNIGELGFDVSSYRYEETSNGSFFMSNEDNKVGIAVSFSQALRDHWFWGGDARHAFGNASYTSASTGSKGNNPDVITEYRLTGGKDYAFGSFVLAPYFGLGQRELSNDMRGYTTTGSAGYRRFRKYTYMPIGITHRMRAGTYARWSTSLEYDVLIEAREKSYMSDVISTSNDPVTVRRQGYGMRLVAGYETFSWTFGAYAHYWSLGDSDQALRTLNGAPSGLIMQPQNTTREVGLQFRLHFN